MIALVTLLTSTLAGAAAVPAPLSCDEGRLTWQRDGLAIEARADGFHLRAGAPSTPAAPAPSNVVLSAEEGLVAQGALLKSCDANKRCNLLGRLPATVTAAIAQRAGWIYAGGAPVPGLYRAVHHAPLTATLIAPGEVLGLCAVDDVAWALVVQGGKAQLVAAAAETPATRSFGFGEALLHAIAADDATSPATARSVLGTVVRLALPEREAILLAAARHARPEVRAAAAGPLASLVQSELVAALWLLAHDNDAGVRRAAFDAVAERARSDRSALASDLLAMFVRDPDPEIGWSARDLLLDRQPGAALVGAPSAYKLDALALLARRIEREGLRALHDPLRLLTSDGDPAVRQAARLLAGEYEP